MHFRPFLRRGGLTQESVSENRSARPLALDDSSAMTAELDAAEPWRKAGFLVKPFAGNDQEDGLSTHEKRGNLCRPVSAHRVFLSRTSLAGSSDCSSVCSPGTVVGRVGGIGPDRDTDRVAPPFGSTHHRPKWHRTTTNKRDTGAASTSTAGCEDLSLNHGVARSRCKQRPTL